MMKNLTEFETQLKLKSDLKATALRLNKQVEANSKKIEKLGKEKAYLTRKLQKSCEKRVAEIKSGEITGREAIEVTNNILILKKQYPDILAHIQI